MATPWPHRKTWPTLIREHAANVSAFAHEILHLIERSGSQSVPVDVVGDIICGVLATQYKRLMDRASNIVHSYGWSEHPLQST
jgi:hypothetical protein